MKNFRKTPVLLMLLALLIGFSCKDKKTTEPDPEQEQIDKLAANSWKVTNSGGMVTLDGADRTADFSSFVLTITNNKTYSTSGVPAIYSGVWPSSGSWDFKSTGSAIPDLTTVVRDGSIEVSIDVLTTTQLVLSFTYVTGSIEGTTGTEGNYVFSLIPN